MERDTKILLGKILGEIYRIEKRLPNMACPATKGHIYGLLHGFEIVIEDELEKIGFVPGKDMADVAETLYEIRKDKENLENLRGIDDIEKKLASIGVYKERADEILRYFYTENKFTEVFNKIDPAELQWLNLSESDE